MREARTRLPRRHLLLATLVTACVTPLQPTVDLAPGASLKAYHAFVVAPVTDASGYPFSFNVTDSLRQRIAVALLEHRLLALPAVPDTGPAPLVITSTLLGFRSGALMLGLGGGGGGGMTSMCRLASRLTDGRTGARVGDVVASEISGQGSGAPSLTPYQLLMTCAQLVADAINSKVRSK